MARGKCICGRNLSEHPEAVECIMREMQYCPPESIGNAVRNYIDSIAQFKIDIDRVMRGMSDRRSNIRYTRQDIYDIVDEIEDKSTLLENLKDIGILEAQRRDVVALLKAEQSKHDDFTREKAIREDTISRYETIRDRYLSSITKNRDVMLYISYAEAVAEWINETYEKKEVEVRNKLQDRINNIFTQMYHGHRRIVIDPKYNVKLITDIRDSSRYTGESEGLNRVKNFAFIAGLVSLAKEKITSSSDDDFDLSSEPYPLVMDAPFSNTDETHIANISRVLPEASEQVIMFVMLKDWRYAEPVLSARIGKKYVLDKKSEQYSVLKEV